MRKSVLSKAGKMPREGKQVIGKRSMFSSVFDTFGSKLFGINWRKFSFNTNLEIQGQILL